MAKADDNVLLNKLSGSIGKQVTIKQRGGKTIVSKAQQPREKPATEKQQEAQEKFADASAYAKRVLADPDMVAQYRMMALPGQNAYNVALKDAYNAPVIENLEAGKPLPENPAAGASPGNKSTPIHVRAVDDFRVFQVIVTIHSAEGVQLEKGNALMGRNGKDWVYTASTVSTGCKVTAMAEDLPGNQTKREIVIA